jgi:hypothetical protein
MLGQSQLPYGYFYDEDGNPDTDATTVANWNGTAWETYILIDPDTGEPQFTSEGDYMRPDNVPVPVPDNVLAQWCNQTDDTLGLPFTFVTVLDDMGLTNNNYHITVTDDAYNKPNFTLRITNTGETNPLGTPWLEFSPPEIAPDFACPDVTPAIAVDVDIKRFDVDRYVRVKETSKIKVYFTNDGPDAASGTLSVVGVDSKGKTVAEFSDDFMDLAAGDWASSTFFWTAPRRSTEITWTATLDAEGDTDLSNNTATAKTIVSDRKKRRGRDD